MKRLCLFLLAALFLALPLTVSADGTVSRKDYEIAVMEGAGEYLHGLTGETAFWEYPLLRAGECRTDGVITFKNNGKRDIRTGFAVTLPYDDLGALEYLNYVRIEMRREDGSVVYDGPYVHIADNGPLDPDNVVRAGGTSSWTVRLWCDYTFAGDVADSRGIQWQMTASEYREENLSPAPGTPSGLWILAVLGGAVVVLLLCVILRKVRNHPSGASRR